MEDYIGKTCPYCKTEIKEDDIVKVCPSCGIPHHEACWIENKGCTTSGCAEQHYEEQHTKPSDICMKCGAPLGDGHDFCPKCGTPKVSAEKTFCVKCGAPLGDGQDFCPKCGTPKEKAKKKVCGKCGVELEDGQAFCPKCGTKVDVAPALGVTTATNPINAKVDHAAKKSKKIPVIIASAAGVVVIAVVILIIVLGKGSGKKVNFDKLYYEYCNSIWASVGSDGSYLTIDTNPYDEDDNGLAYPGAYTAIENVNNALGLPDSLINEMGCTTGADGKQTENFDELGITVSWKYHPDKGLEVTYKKI